MKNIIDVSLDVPAERDLPPRSAARMRAHLMASLSRPQARPVRRLGLAAMAAAAVTAAAVAADVWMVPNDDGAQHLAMGPDELSPTLRQAMEQCLSWSAQQGQVAVSMADLAVAAEAGSRSVALFMTKTAYLTCEVSMSRDGVPSGGMSSDRWPQRDWLPGPVQRLLLTSTESHGGDVAVSGRVSARVHRLVLEHGDGETTTARLADGVFGLLTEGAKVNQDAELVSYDKNGNEIDRRRLFSPSEEFSPCYTDSSGTVVYGKPGTDCLPAERWSPLAEDVP